MNEQQIAEAQLNPTSIETQVKDIVNAVKGGWLNPIEAVGAIKHFKEVLDAASKDLKDEAINALRSYPSGFENESCKIELRGSGGRWNYKHIPEWNEKKSELDAIQERAKAQYKAELKGDAIVDSDGVVSEPAKYSGGGETVVITLKK